MRGGTSKAACFLHKDLPASTRQRDAVLLSVMGSPDPRQIDGIGGADPLTSKVAIVKPSSHADCDVDYLFAQVKIDQAWVDYGQNCGNILAAVGAFALERNLVALTPPLTPVRVFMENTGQRVIVNVPCDSDGVLYQGNVHIAGVPGSAGGIELFFPSLTTDDPRLAFPTGQKRESILDIDVTCINNGMPVVLLCANALGLQGHEPPELLEQDGALMQKIDAIRLAAGERMGLGEVSQRSVPKVVLLSTSGVANRIITRSFSAQRCHRAIGVFAAISVASALLTPGTLGADFTAPPTTTSITVDLQHPSGVLSIDVALSPEGLLLGCHLLRTARLLFAGEVMIPAHVWP